MPILMALMPDYYYQGYHKLCKTEKFENKNNLKQGNVLSINKFTGLWTNSVDAF